MWSRRIPREQLREALAKLLTYGDHVVVEKKIKGREIQIAVLGDTLSACGGDHPPWRIFRLRFQISEGRCSGDLPRPPITEEEWHQIGEMALKLHRGLGLSVYSPLRFFAG